MLIIRVNEETLSSGRPDESGFRNVNSNCDYLQLLLDILADDSLDWSLLVNEV